MLDDVPDAAEFSAWHADVHNSPACQLIFQQALGLPPEVVSNSLLTWAGVAEVTDALRLSPGQTLVDLACGRGGYGREVARRTGARLLGFDFAAVAVTLAARAGAGGAAPAGAAPAASAAPARFCVGDFTAVGLRDRGADAVMCIDAVQFGEPPLAVLLECRRILAEQGRLVVTAWEPIPPADERLPQKTRRMNLTRDLARAGFEQVTVTEMPRWADAERALWEAALAGDADGDPALASLQREARTSLDTFDVKRRVFAVATAPRCAIRI